MSIQCILTRATFRSYLTPSLPSYNCPSCERAYYKFPITKSLTFDVSTFIESRTPVLSQFHEFCHMYGNSTEREHTLAATLRQHPQQRI